MNKYLILMAAVIAAPFAAESTISIQDGGSLPMKSTAPNLIVSDALRGPTMMTEEQWAKENGKAIVTLVECEEVVWAIDTLRSYCEDYRGITVSDLVYRDQSESQRLRDAAEKAEHKEKQIEKAKGVLEKWRKRVDAIKGTKP